MLDYSHLSEIGLQSLVSNLVILDLLVTMIERTLNWIASRSPFAILRMEFTTA